MPWACAACLVRRMVEKYYRLPGSTCPLYERHRSKGRIKCGRRHASSSMRDDRQLDDLFLEEALLWGRA